MKLQKRVLNDDIANTIYNITKNNPSIVKVGIFGSYARGENNQDSDIDILYEHTDGNESLLDDLYSFACSLETELPRVLDNPKLIIDFVTIDGLNSGIMKEPNQPIIQNILNDVIWIHSRTGRGDYTNERHEIFEGMSVNDIFNDMQVNND